MRLNEFNFGETAVTTGDGNCHVNNILEEMRVERTGLQSQISSLNVKYVVVYNFKPLQRTVNAVT